MLRDKILNIIKKQNWLDSVGDVLKPAILKGFERAGRKGVKIKNALHGTWLGHPLHPVITDVPIGAWTAAAALDGLEVVSGKDELAKGADTAIAVGIIGAVGAAATGLTDWTGTTKTKRRLGLVHGMLNLGATALYTTSFILRRQKKSRGLAIGLSFLGYGMTTAAAYLGGQMVYNEQLGVDHTATSEPYPEKIHERAPR